MHQQLEEAIRDYLKIEKVSRKQGIAIIKQYTNPATCFSNNSSDLAEFYLANEKIIKEYLVEQGEQMEDIGEAVLYVFETICEEMEEKAAIIDEYNEYDDEYWEEQQQLCNEEDSLIQEYLWDDD